MTRPAFRRSLFAAELREKIGNAADALAGQNAVAREIGIAPSTLSRLLRGRSPSAETFARIVAWGFPLGELGRFVDDDWRAAGPTAGGTA